MQVPRGRQVGTKGRCRGRRKTWKIKKNFQKILVRKLIIRWTIHHLHSGLKGLKPLKVQVLSFANYSRRTYFFICLQFPPFAFNFIVKVGDFLTSLPAIFLSLRWIPYSVIYIYLFNFLSLPSLQLDSVWNLNTNVERGFFLVRLFIFVKYQIERCNPLVTLPLRCTRSGVTLINVWSSSIDSQKRLDLKKTTRYT